MLIHLIGDVHQPLHTVNRNDFGGNKVVVPNIHDAMVEAFPNRKNLHYFWDSSYRRVMKDGQAVESFTSPPYLPSNPALSHANALPLVVGHTARLEKSHQPDKYPATGSPEDWVRESHAQGYDHVYQALPGGDAANPVTLDETYVDNARALAEQKLIQGGHRLADLLNELFQ
jgi:hypothetical protein